MSKGGISIGGSVGGDVAGRDIQKAGKEPEATEEKPESSMSTKIQLAAVPIILALAGFVVSRLEACS